MPPVDITPFLRCPNIITPISALLDLLIMICLWAVVGGCETDTSLVWFILIAHFASTIAIIAFVLMQRWDSMPFDKTLFALGYSGVFGALYVLAMFVIMFGIGDVQIAQTDGGTTTAMVTNTLCNNRPSYLVAGFFMLGQAACCVLATMAAYKEYRQESLLPTHNAPGDGQPAGAQPGSYMPYE